MAKRTVDIPKADVKRLTDEQLKALAELSDSDGLKLLSSICEDFVKGVTEMALPLTDNESRLQYLDAAYHMRNSLSFLLDAPQRAKEELKDRG